jgi:hypothetical protein
VNAGVQQEIALTSDMRCVRRRPGSARCVATMGNGVRIALAASVDEATGRVEWRRSEWGSRDAKAASGASLLEVASAVVTVSLEGGAGDTDGSLREPRRGPAVSGSLGRPSGRPQGTKSSSRVEVRMRLRPAAMELTVVLSNHEGLDRLRELVDRLGITDRSLAARRDQEAEARGLPKAILRVVAPMPEGLRLRDIHVAAEALLGEPAPRSTVMKWRSMTDAPGRRNRRFVEA